MGRRRKEGNGGSETTTSTDSGNTENKRRSTTEGTTDNTEGITNQEISESNLVKPEIVEIEIPQPKEKKAYKPRESKKKNQVGEAEISALISGMFGLVSLKAGEHWIVSIEESQTISIPLCRILDKMNLVEKVSNISDGLMLLMSCAMITIPRILITVDIEKKKKESKIQELKNDVKKVASDSEFRNNDNKGDVQPVSTNGDYIKALGYTGVEEN